MQQLIRRSSMLVGSMCFFCAAPVAAHPDNIEYSVSSVGLSGGQVNFVDDGLAATYGNPASVGLRLTRGQKETADLVVELSHCTATGHARLGTPDFLVERAARIRMVPIVIGFRANATDSPVYRFYFGMGAQFVWVRETLPWSHGDYRSDRDETSSYSGWGFGGLIKAGPEFWFGRHRYAVGAEWSLGLCRPIIKSGMRERELDLARYAVRGYFLMRLGSPG